MIYQRLFIRQETVGLRSQPTGISPFTFAADISIVLCLLMTIWTVNDFDTPWLLTLGGPANASENLVVLAYKYTFAGNSGARIRGSFVTLLILLVFIIFMLRK